MINEEEFSEGHSAVWEQVSKARAFYLNNEKRWIWLMTTYDKWNTPPWRMLYNVLMTMMIFIFWPITAGMFFLAAIYVLVGEWSKDKYKKQWEKVVNHVNMSLGIELSAPEIRSIEKMKHNG